jgi:hypothetical protein
VKSSNSIFFNKKPNCPMKNPKKKKIHYVKPALPSVNFVFWLRTLLNLWQKFASLCQSFLTLN